jgi:hypothetical protein
MLHEAPERNLGRFLAIVAEWRGAAEWRVAAASIDLGGTRREHDNVHDNNVAMVVIAMPNGRNCGASTRGVY